MYKTAKEFLKEKGLPFEANAKVYWYHQPQWARLLSSIEGLSDDELHAVFVRNAVRKYEEASKQLEQLFQEPEEDGIDLDELFGS